eukprot:COSAG02_NODE_2252_length_9361_cov_26.363097_6_plen_349_part_00
MPAGVKPTLGDEDAGLGRTTEPGLRQDGTKPYFDPTLACWAGAAKVDTTPPVGIYTRMWGAALHDCATDVHRPGYASALALSDSGKGTIRLVVTLDACVMGSAETEELIAAVMQALQLRERSQIVFTMSHTHASAGILSRGKELLELPGGHLIPGYVDKVISGCVKAAILARDAMEPAWMTVGTGSCKLACNRDTWDANGTATAPPGAGTSTKHTQQATKGQWVCGYGADSVQGPADDTLMVARIASRSLGKHQIAEPDFSGNTIGTGVDATSRTIAIIYNYVRICSLAYMFSVLCQWVLRTRLVLEPKSVLWYAVVRCRATGLPPNDAGSGEYAHFSRFHWQLPRNS